MNREAVTIEEHLKALASIYGPLMVRGFVRRLTDVFLGPRAREWYWP